MADNFFVNLSNSIGHIEAQYNIQLNSIYLNTFNSSTSKIFKSVGAFEKDTSKQINEMIYIDISFKI